MVPLYLRPDLASELAGYSNADRDLVMSFAERGYVVVDLDLPDELLDRIVRDTVPLYKSETRLQDVWLWARSEPVRELACHPAVLELLEKLHGRAAFPFQTLNFNVGTQQPTHSDTIHFDSFPPGYMAGVWVALEDIDEANGPLHYYPGSHRLPQVTLADMGARGWGQGYSLYSRVYEPGIQKMIDDLGLVKEGARIKKGQALVWSANLLHGGEPILDPTRTRHSQVTHYYFEGCAWSIPINSDIPLGRVRRKHALDARTRTFAPQEYLGKRIPVAMRDRLILAARRVLAAARPRRP